MNRAKRIAASGPLVESCTASLHRAINRFPTSKVTRNPAEWLVFAWEEAAIGGAGRTSYSGEPLLIATIPLQKTSKEVGRAVIWITFADSGDSLGILPLDFRIEKAQNPVLGNEFIEVGVLSGRTQFS